MVSHPSCAGGYDEIDDGIWVCGGARRQRAPLYRVEVGEPSILRSDAEGSSEDGSRGRGAPQGRSEPVQSRKNRGLREGEVSSLRGRRTQSRYGTCAKIQGEFCETRARPRQEYGGGFFAVCRSGSIHQRAPIGWLPFAALVLDRTPSQSRTIRRA